jgi:hypothetical protein
MKFNPKSILAALVLASTVEQLSAQSHSIRSFARDLAPTGSNPNGAKVKACTKESPWSPIPFPVAHSITFGEIAFDETELTLGLGTVRAGEAWGIEIDLAMVVAILIATIDPGINLFDFYLGAALTSVQLELVDADDLLAETVIAEPGEVIFDGALRFKLGTTSFYPSPSAELDIHGGTRGFKFIVPPEDIRANKNYNVNARFFFRTLAGTLPWELYAVGLLVDKVMMTIQDSKVELGECEIVLPDDR